LVEKIRVCVTERSLETLIQPINPDFSAFKTTDYSGGRHVDTYGRNRGTISVFRDDPQAGRDRSLQQPVPDFIGDSAVAGTWRCGQWVPGQGGGYPHRSSNEFEIASGSVDRAEHERVDGSGNGRHGGASCGCEDLVWSGVFERDDRPHEYRDVPESAGGPGSRGDQSDCGEGGGEGGIYGKRAVFLGYNGAGVADRVSDGSGTFEEHRSEACGDWDENQEEGFREIGKTGTGGSAHLHADPIVYTRQGREGLGEEEKAVPGTSENGFAHETSDSGESERTEREIAGAVSGSSRSLWADVVADPALDENGFSSSRQDHQLVGATSASDYEEQGGQTGGVWEAVDHYAIEEWLHHRDTVPEAGRRCGHIDPAGGVGAFRTDHGRDSQHGGIRSWRGWSGESRSSRKKGDRECDFPEGQGIPDWAGTEHGSQGPPGTRLVRGSHRDDQAFAIWIQQTKGKIIGGVYPEGAISDFGSEFDSHGKRLDGSGGDGMKVKQKKKVKGEKSGGGKIENATGIGKNQGK